MSEIDVRKDTTGIIHLGDYNTIVEFRDELNKYFREISRPYKDMITDTQALYALHIGGNRKNELAVITGWSWIDVTITLQKRFTNAFLIWFIGPVIIHREHMIATNLEYPELTVLDYSDY